jgi:replication factor A1
MLFQIKDLQKDAKRVNIILKLVTRYEPRYAKGHKITTFVAADHTGTILIPFWNADGETVKVSDTIEIQNGYVTEFQGKVQLNVGKFGSFHPIEPSESFKALQTGKSPQLSELSASNTGDAPPISLEEFLAQQRGKYALHLFISEQLGERRVHTKLDGKEHKIVSWLVGDPSGCIQLDAWDAQNDTLEIGISVCFQNATIRTYQKRRYLGLGQYSTVAPLATDVEINLTQNFSENAAASFEE